MTALNSAAAIMLIAASVAILWSVFFKNPEPPGPKPPAEPISLEGVATRGDRSAKLAVIEYADLECPACAKFAKETAPGFVERYVSTGKVLFAFKHFPLPQHQSARKAAEAIECAGKQGHFWEMYGAAYASSPALDESNLLRLGSSIGLDDRTFISCLAGNSGTNVDRDLTEARRFRLTSTPTFVIGEVLPDGRVKGHVTMAGVGPAEGFYKILDSLLKRTSALTK